MEAWVWVLLIIIVIVIIVAIVLITRSGSPSTGNGADNGGGPGGGGSIASCSQSSDCQSGNCSLGFCQPGTEITRTVGAACVSSTPSTSVAGCVTGLACVRQGGATTGVCTAGTNPFFTSCTTGLNQCMAFNACVPLDGISDIGGTYCLFRSDPNICPAGECLPGYSCTFSSSSSSDATGNNGTCLAGSGLPCTSSSQCSSTVCAGPGVAIWNGNEWKKYATVTTGVDFNRLIAVSTTNGDDLWAIDTSTGIYHLPAGSTDFVQILQNTTQRMINGDNQTMAVVDLAVDTNNIPYILYSAPSNGSTVYLIFTVNLSGATVSLNPFLTSNGIQQEPGGDNFNQIVGLDAIVSGGITGVVINAQPMSSDNFEQYISSSGTNGGDWQLFTDGGDPVNLTANNITRYVPNPDLSGDDQSMNVSQLQMIPNETYRGIFCIGCSYVGQPTGTNNNSPIGVDNLMFSDYAVTVTGTSSSPNTTYYFLGQVNGQYNLYIAPDNVMSSVSIYLGPVSILPGYYNSSSRVAAAGPNLYVYSNQTCS